MHRCMCLWHQHASRCTGKSAEGCRDSTGLVAVVVLIVRTNANAQNLRLRCLFMLTATLTSYKI